MAHLLGIVLPLALGAAVSPTVLAVQLLMMSRRTSPLARAWAVAAGCAVVLAGFAVIALLVAGTTHKHGSRSDAGAIVKLVAAVLLVALGVRTLRRPPRPPRPERQGGHLLTRAFLLGVALMLADFSSIILFFPAMHEIGVSDVSLGGKVGVFVLLYAITLLPATAPPLVVTLLGERAKSPLDRLNRFLASHQTAISVALCFGFAVLLAAEGVGALV